MIETKMATWVLLCTLSAPHNLPDKRYQEGIPNPQECETLASNCWRTYYKFQEDIGTSFDTSCTAIANHRIYSFHYTCDKNLQCHRL